MARRLTDVEMRDLERMVLAGWRNSQIEDHFQADADSVRVWKKRLRARHRDSWNQKPAEFLAGCEAFFVSLEERALAELDAKDADGKPRPITATQQAALIKQAREARQSRIKLRIDTGKIQVVDQDADPDKLTDEQIDRELGDNAKRLGVLRGVASVPHGRPKKPKHRARKLTREEKRQARKAAARAKEAAKAAAAAAGTKAA